MALLVRDVLNAMKDRLPFFTDRLVPMPTQLRLLTDTEGSLCALAHQQNAHYLEQRATVFLTPSTADAVGTAGAGTDGGFGVTEAGAVDFDGLVGRTQSYDLSSPLEAYRVVAAGASTTSVPVSGTPWTVNQWAGKLLVIIAGTGAGPTGVQTIASNTTSTLTLNGALGAAPDTTSIIGIFAATPQVDPEDSLVTDLTLLRTDVGYITKIDATGTAYLDVTTPLTASYQKPVPMPQIGGLLSAQYWETGVNVPRELMVLPANSRALALRGPAVTYTGGKLTLIGDQGTWQNVVSLDVFYQPIPPTLTSTSQTMLLPDIAREPLACLLAVSIARRMVRADQGLDPDGSMLPDIRQEASEATDNYLSQIRQVGIARSTTIVEAF